MAILRNQPQPFRPAPSYLNTTPTATTYGLGQRPVPQIPQRQTDIGIANGPGYGRGAGYTVYDPFNPGGQIGCAFGPGARNFFESGGVDPRYSAGLRERAERDAGSR